MKSLPRRFLYSAALVLAIAGIIALILIKGPLAPINIETASLQEDDLHPAVYGIGTVEAQRAYALGFTRSGRLLELKVDQGDRVQAGQQLGRLDPVDLPARIRSAEAMVKKTEKLTAAAEASLREAQARYRQARKEMLRYQELARQKQVSQEVADNRTSEAMAALQKVKEVEANLAAIKLDSQRAREDLKALQAQMAELDLVSPADGIISARNIDPGSVVSPGFAVLDLVDPDSFWVRTRIDQAQSGSLKTGQAASIELRSELGRLHDGRIERIEIVADSLTEERIVDVAFDQRPDNLSLGMLAHVTLKLPVIPHARWLPAAALVYRQGKAGVWILDGDRVHFTEVHTGLRTLDGKLQILDGLKASDRVALYPDKPLAEGSRVKIKTSKPAS